MIWKYCCIAVLVAACLITAGWMFRPCVEEPNKTHITTDSVCTDKSEPDGAHLDNNEPAGDEHNHMLKGDEYLHNRMATYMSTHTRISDEQRIYIIKEIMRQSRKYNTDSRLLYAVLFTESRFSNDKQHKSVYVKRLGREVQAVGMGGIIWDFWGDYLIANTSLEGEDDLRDWRKNIEATASILAFLSSHKIHPKAQDIKESAAIRYYGLYNEHYVKSINLAYNRL